MQLKDISLRLGVLLLLLVGTAGAQTKTTISDRVANLSGSPLVGNSVTIVLTHTMTTADGYTILQGTQVVEKIPTSGNFSVALPPNLGSTPTGTSYEVSYATASSRFKETWIVPTSVAPVTLSMVRSLSAPIPSLQIPFPQNVPPPGCTATNMVPIWVIPPGQWSCGNANLGTVSMNLESPTAADSGKWQWKPKNSLLIKRVSCSTDQGSALVNLDVRSESSPNSAGPSVLFSALNCTPSGNSSTEIGTASVSALSPVALIVASVSGGPTVLRVFVEYQLNP